MRRRNGLGWLMLLLAACVLMTGGCGGGGRNEGSVTPAPSEPSVPDEQPGVADTSWYDVTTTDLSIGNGAQLRGLAAIANDSDRFKGKTIKLAANIDVAGEWTPIGEFEGTFDGGGHTITFKNMTFAARTLAVDDDSDVVTGFIGVHSGELLNTTYDNVNISSKEDSIGGLVGRNAGTIENCHVKSGSVKGDGGGTRGVVGGLVGRNTGTITNCTYSGSVAGRHSGGLVSENSGTITNCTASVSGGGPIGGLVYENSGTITNCTTSGSGGGSIGGLVYENSGMITNCTASVKVGGDRVGGLVVANYGTITNCKSSGSVFGGGYSTSDYAGGLVGENGVGGTITDCTASGSVSGGPVGGLVGRNFGAITNCKSSGSVSLNDRRKNIVECGGLVGVNESTGTITNCLASGKITPLEGQVQTLGIAGTNSNRAPNSITGNFYDKPGTRASWGIGKDARHNGMPSNDGAEPIGEGGVSFFEKNGRWVSTSGSGSGTYEGYPITVRMNTYRMDVEFEADLNLGNLIAVKCGPVYANVTVSAAGMGSETFEYEYGTMRLPLTKVDENTLRWTFIDGEDLTVTFTSDTQAVANGSYRDEDGSFTFTVNLVKQM
ncbi:hypothetical protein FACS1894187_21990 [Synergistales bacterium]|nr:hypothetical protein FACS1894187_21990 [Synergistales bacterium]